MATASDTRTVVGVFNSVQDAQDAVRELENSGITRSDISIVANKNAVGYDTMDSADRDKASDVVADAGIGAAIGGVGGLLLSAAGALTIPVIGPILAAGPIAAALTGAGIGAAAGGLVGALTETGVPEEHARYYAEGVRRGDVLVTVKAPYGREDTVCDILDRNHAIDVDERVTNWKQRGWTGYREDATPFSDEEYRRERTYYNTGSTLTGETGIGVDRARSTLEREPSTTPGTTTLGLSGSTLSRDPRGPMEKAGDKMREWKEDVKDAVRDDDRRTGAWNTEVRDTGYDSRSEHAADRNVGAWADQTRGDFGSAGTRTGDALGEMKRDAKEAWRDTKDAMHGRTGTQPHDVREDIREGARDASGRSYTGSRTNDAVDETKRDAKEAWRDTKDVLQGRTGTQPHDVREDAREAERRRRARVYDRTII